LMVQTRVFAVLGANGRVGRAVCKNLLALGQGARAVCRNPPSDDPGVTFASADVTSRDQLAFALEGVTGAFVMCPRAEACPDSVRFAERISENITWALKSAGVQQVVALSSIGAHLSSGLGSLQTARVLEQALSTHEGYVTTVRSAWFIENWRGMAKAAAAKGILPSVFEPLEKRLPQVCVDDVGLCVARSLMNSPINSSIIEFEGPTRYSPRCIADAFEQVLGHEVEPMHLDEAQQAKILSMRGFSPRNVELELETVHGFNSGHIVFEGGHVSEHGATDAEDFAAALIESHAEWVNPEH